MADLAGALVEIAVAVEQALGKGLAIMGQGLHDLSRVDRYDPSTNTWDTVASLPWPRSALAGCAYEGSVYAIGGFSMALGYQRTVARFTPDSGAGRWDVVESLGTPRTNPAAAVAGGRMCAVGGQFFSELTTFEQYQSGGWAQDSRHMNSSRSGCAAVGWGRWLCAIGGQARQGPTNSVELINVDSGGWQAATDLPGERVFHGSAVADGFVVVMGGRTQHGADGSVAKHDSTLFPAGIEEPETQVQVQTAPRWATVAAGHVRITCRSAEVFDGSGRRVFAGSGPVNVALAPGVYFARVADANGRLETGRITVIR